MKNALTRNWYESQSSRALWLGIGAVLLAIVAAGKLSAQQRDAAGDVEWQAIKSTVYVKHLEVPGWGSGWVYDQKRRLIVTNAHVVASFFDRSDEATGGELTQHFFDSAKVIFPHFKDGKLVTSAKFYETKLQELTSSAQHSTGVVIHADTKRDLAMIQLSAFPDDAPAIPLATRSQEPGDKHVAVGHPFNSNERWRFTSGETKSRGNQKFVMTGVGGKTCLHLDCDMIHTAAHIFPGNSGGPVINEKGELIGVVDAKLANDEGLFIDLVEVRKFLRDCESIMSAKSADELCMLGHFYWDRGRLIKASESFHAAALRRSEVTDIAADPCLDLAAVYREMRLFDNSLSWCDNAIADNLSRPGRAHAERAATRLAQLPDEAFLPVNKKGAFWRPGDRSGPLYAAYRKQVEDAQKESDAFWTPRKKAVLDDINLAISANPRLALAFQVRADYFRREAAPVHSKILADRELVVKLRNNAVRRDAKAYLDRAQAYFEAGLLKQAAADCHLALAIAPQSSVAYARLAKIEEQAGRENEAALALGKLVKRILPNGQIEYGLDFKNPDYLEAMARLLVNTKDPKGLAVAEVVLTTLVTVVETELEALPQRRYFVQRGDVYVKLQQPEKARADYLAALNLPDPTADQRPDCDEVAAYQAKYSIKAILAKIDALPPAPAAGN